VQIVQLQELFDVRHSVFIVGNAGTGKTMVWKSLLKANQNMKKKPIAIDLNPKAVTNNELFGIINPATREWKDGKSTCRIKTARVVEHKRPYCTSCYIAETEVNKKQKLLFVNELSLQSCEENCELHYSIYLAGKYHSMPTVYFDLE